MSFKCFINTEKSPTKRVIHFFWIPIYLEENFNGGEKKISLLYSLFKIRETSYKTEFFLCGIRIYRKLDIEKMLNQATVAILHKTEAKLKTLIQCQSLHKETFEPYRNIFNGKKVALVASGPTSKYHTKRDDYVYVGVNNSCLLENIELDYLFCQDFYMNSSMREAIAGYRPGRCQKFFGRIPDIRYEKCLRASYASHVRRIPKKFILKAQAREYYIQDEYVSSFALDIEHEPLSPCGIVFPAMQFILHGHPQEIYLVGCDCSSGFFYKSDVTFDNSYQITAWKRLKQHVDILYPDIKVFSINPVGLKGIWNDVYTNNYLEENPTAKNDKILTIK